MKPPPAQSIPVAADLVDMNELVTPAKFTSFWRSGKSGLYIHPNIWRRAVVPIGEHALPLDRRPRR